MAGVVRFIFTGGGTGGHVYPGLAVARELQRQGHQVAWIGTRGRAEERILPREEGIQLYFAASMGFPGKRPLPLLRFLLVLLWGCLCAGWRLLVLRPHVVFAAGGYASAPTVFAAAILRRLFLLRCRILLHEQNVSPGLLNRVAARVADRCALTFPGSCPGMDASCCLTSGYPVRGDLNPLPERAEACKRLGLDPQKACVFFFGGSQGARSINRSVYELLPELLKQHVQVIHAYGTSADAEYNASSEHQQAMDALQHKLGGDPATRGYLGREYFFDIRDCYAAADLVVCRAGAGSIFEVLGSGLAAILIPKMGLPGDHQVCNALRVGQQQAARVILEEPRLSAEGIVPGVSTKQLGDCITELLQDTAVSAEMRQRARGLYHSNALQTLLNLALEAADNRLSAPSLQKVEGPQAETLTERSETQLLQLAAKPNLDASQLAYLRYRSGAALVSSEWQKRNAGIKLAGMLKLESALPLLLHLASDTRKPPLMKRFFGESHYQNGFIRRNLATALGQIGSVDGDVCACLEGMLQDGYWEVRVAAMESLAQLGCDTPGAEARERLQHFLRRGNFEEQQAAISWWLVTHPAGEWRETLMPLLNHQNSKVRERAVHALLELVRGGRVSGADVRPILEDVLVTSTRFKPSFPLKQSMRDLARVIEEQEQC